MGWDKTTTGLAIIDKQIADFKIKLDPNAEIVQQMAIAREFFADKAAMTLDELDAKWKDRILDFYKAQLTVGNLSEAITELVKNQKEPLGKYMKVVLGGSLAQGGPAGGQPRDWFYELWLGSVLSQAGFTVHFQEPDLVIEGNGLSQKISLACKYPSSEKGIHDHLSKGLKQLKTHGLPGFIALGVDQIVVEKGNLKKFVDFNEGGKHPIEVLQPYADEQAVTLVKERPTKHPGEDPVDELLVTLSVLGHYGKPAALIAPTAFAIHCTNKSPIFNDIAIIVNAIGKLPGN